jgi:archaellum component FlaF (FlaF/FlaG flagellin family)
MAKTVYLETGDYKIKVANPSNEITLDSALTHITGDLRVEGETTTVNTTNLEIEDNIIVLNKNEAGAGVGEGTSGVDIDRGSYANVQIVYDESIAWNNPSTQTVSQGPGLQGPGYGSFKVSSADGNDILALRVANINNTNAIYFEPGGTGTLRLGGSIAPANYISRMNDDNDIPNKKYVDDEINAVVIGAAFPRIVQDDTEVKITDNSQSGQTSKIEVTIDGTLLGLWEPTRFELYQQTTDIGSIRIEDDTISSLNSNQDLELVAPGTGSVRVNDSFVINNRPSIQDPAVDPLYDANGVKLYAKSPSGGDTGLYFVNTNDTRGEVISKNRALLFGLLF